MTVLIEKKDSIFTVIINRPGVKNAVDGPTAMALADAFREFEKDDAFSVAVLCGIGNTFCAGADLKAFNSLDRSGLNRLEPECRDWRDWGHPIMLLSSKNFQKYKTINIH